MVTSHNNKTYAHTSVYMMSVAMETQTKQIEMQFYKIFNRFLLFYEFCIKIRYRTTREPTQNFRYK